MATFIIPNDKDLLTMIEKAVLCSDMKVSTIISNIHRELLEWAKKNNHVAETNLYAELKASEIF